MNVVAGKTMRPSFAFCTISKKETTISKEMTDDRLFLRTIKPFFSDKKKSNQEIILIESDKVTETYEKVPSAPNNFSSSIVTNLKIID